MDEKEEKIERVCIFIDGGNLYKSLERLKIDRVDYKKLIKELAGNRTIVKTFYYIAPLDINYNPEKYWKHQKFLNELKKIPNFSIVLCTLRKVKKYDKTEFEIKGDDVHLTVDLISEAYENTYDAAILVSGDEDFVPAIKKVKKLDKKVENAYFISSSSVALKKIADSSICINNIINKIKYLPGIAMKDHTGEVINK